jgi:hypothetical protein
MASVRDVVQTKPAIMNALSGSQKTICHCVVLVTLFVGQRDRAGNLPLNKKTWRKTRNPPSVDGRPINKWAVTQEQRVARRKRDVNRTRAWISAST